jgi:hypothetical protein
VIQEERESQLSAMFDGELPATECELLSRRIDRDENLRARWSRYALIGAAMRSEPVATARSGFARRVSAALRGGDTRVRASRGRKMMLNAAVSASLVVGVAGMSITLLRYTAAGGGAAAGGQVASGQVGGGPVFSGEMDSAAVPSRAPGSGAVSGNPVARSTAAGSTAAISSMASDALARRASNGEPVSYVTPASVDTANTALRTELADFIVAHSQYSTPLMRRNMLSAFISSDAGSDFAPSRAAVTASPSASAAGALHATFAASAPGH